MSSQELPTVAVLIPTYRRKEVLKQTINLIQTNLKYKGEVFILIGDDSVSEEEGFRLYDFDQHLLIEGLLLSPYTTINVDWHEEQFGLGRNLNSLLRQAQSQGIDYVIQQDDDHWLVEPLDITPHVKKLIEDQSAGAIRLMGVGGHKYRANLEGVYWRIDWFSPELYVASNRPHLKSIARFHGEYGLYPEGEKLGATEEKFNHLCKDKARLRVETGQPTVDVLIPLDIMTEKGWQHNEHHGAISWQARGF